MRACVPCSLDSPHVNQTEDEVDDEKNNDKENSLKVNAFSFISLNKPIELMPFGGSAFLSAQARRFNDDNGMPSFAA